MQNSLQSELSPGADARLSKEASFLTLALNDLSESDQRPERLADIDPSLLTPFQNALLHIDGTVTRFIEAYQKEQTDTLLLDQKTSTLSKPNSYLQLPSKRTVALRQVAIRGRNSGRIYVYASSILVQANLTIDMLSVLNSKDGSLGKMLDICEVESRREMLWYGQEEFSQINGQPGRNRLLRFLTRTYRIIANGAPFVVINEKFPCAPCHDCG